MAGAPTAVDILLARVAAESCAHSGATGACRGAGRWRVSAPEGHAAPEDHVAERCRAGGVDKAAPPGQHVIDQGTEAVVAAALTQQRERVSEFLGQPRFPAPAVRHGLVLGHRSSLVGVGGVRGRWRQVVATPSVVAAWRRCPVTRSNFLLLVCNVRGVSGENLPCRWLNGTIVDDEREMKP